MADPKSSRIGFSYTYLPTICKISTFENIKYANRLLSSNLVSVSSHFMNGLLRNVLLIIKSVVYLTKAGVNNIIPPLATGAQIAVTKRLQKQ